MDQHELVKLIKQAALDLGRTPSRDDFIKTIRNGRDTITKAFGTYAALLQAAGLDSPRFKVSNELLFSKDISDVVSGYHQSPKLPRVRMHEGFETILAIGDAHFPFTNLDILTSIYQFAEIHKPKHIIQGGDLYDMFAQSKFPKSLNIYTPEEELELGRKMALEMWGTLRRICPQAKCYQLLGNHDVRPLKRVLEKAPEVEMFVKRGIVPYFEFDGVHTETDYRQELIIQDILFHHGHKSKLGEHLAFNLMNTVAFHTHRGGTFYRPFRDRILFEANAGYIGDEKSKALGHTPQKSTGWTGGFLWIDYYGPRFIC